MRHALASAGCACAPALPQEQRWWGAWGPRAPARLAPRTARRLRAATGGNEPADDVPPTVLGDWRAFRAALITQTEPQNWNQRVAEANLRLLVEQNPSLAGEETWAHPTPGPEKGGLLIATRSAPEALGDTKMWQAVILLIEHTSSGSIGLLLNRPTAMVLGHKPGGLPFDIKNAPANMQQVFQDNRVYCGGFTGQQVLHILHGHRLEGAVEIVPGVFLGGDAAASREVASENLGTSGFKFFSGAVVWGGDTLEKEMKAGAWYTAAASRTILLKQCLQLPVPLWREVLQLMGGKYWNEARSLDDGVE